MSYGKRGHIALVDMDDTIVDHAKALLRDLESIAGPTDPPYFRHQEDEPDYIKARKLIIRKQVGWWSSLEKYKPGWDILKILFQLDYQVHVLTKGPWSTPNAWTEKVQWCKKWLGEEVKITITSDKSLVYGRVLVDDYPDYIKAWLAWRPRGLVIMPDHPHNREYEDNRVYRYDGSNLKAIADILASHREVDFARLKE